MQRSFTYLLYIVSLTLLLSSCASSGGAGLVDNIEDLNEALASAEAGDVITMANGVWTDAEIAFYNEGTESSPIKLTVEDKGKVTLEGLSNLRMAGQYLIVEGLVFTNGHTPTGEVLSMKKSKTELCNNCRITECVIDDYNPSERHDSDYWVGIYGKNNRFDHNYLVGKRNRGVTLAVRLQTEDSRENNHRIDHNYFGYRPTLGSNGGETMRIGTSHYSLTNSKTIVEDNYFENCSGELEIISSKSCQNTFRNNTFYECQGTMTMRHGNETLVENNYFFGNRKANTGGIRIINESQTVKNNYCEGLTGSRFKGALVIMNGVPNSPANRYVQVTDSEATGNLIIDSDHIQLCAGSDAERSAPPINSKMTNNVIYNTERDEVFTVYDDISGITFSGNYLSPNIVLPKSKGAAVSGFTQKELTFAEKDGLKLPNGIDGIGPNTSIERPGRDNTGVSWYPKKDYTITFSTGKRINVAPGENTIYEAAKSTSKGDVLVLKGGETYHQTKSVDVNHTLSVVSDGGKAKLTFERSSLFNINDGGSLNLEGLAVSGTECDDYAGNSVVRTSRYSMSDNYKFFARDCDFTDLDVNHSFNVLKVYKNSFADSIGLWDCTFDNITGHVLNLDKETDDIGIYNVEHVVVSNCTFTDIGGAAIHLYRGGRDESTFGPTLDMKNSTMTNVGHDKRNRYKTAIGLHGVQYADMQNLQFTKSKGLDMHLVVGEPVIKLSDLTFDGANGITSNSQAYQATNITTK